MIKKFISLLSVFCLMLPCFFSSACKNEDNNAKAAELYNYSVTLKNAKNVINKDTLQPEYDYEEQKNIEWTESDDDYILSVSKAGSVSGEICVDLLEGFDYSNITLNVNDTPQDFKIMSGFQQGCEKQFSLTDRQFYYNYDNMNGKTNIIIDFSDCEWGKVLIDLSELVTLGATAYSVESEFVNLDSDINSTMSRLEGSEILVDYDSVIAIDCVEEFAFIPAELGFNQNVLKSKYASRYFVKNNIIQYFTAKQNGSCTIDNTIKNEQNSGTIRLVGCDDIVAYSTINKLLADESISITTEIERYRGTALKVNVIDTDSVYLKLSEHAQEFNYYLLNEIDEQTNVRNMVEVLQYGDAEYFYLNINVSEANGGDGLAKYLVRRPKSTANYYIVHARDFLDETLIFNADYVLIGSENKPEIPISKTGNLFFGFSKNVSGAEKQVEIKLSKYSQDKSTNYVNENTGVTISAVNYASTGEINTRTIVDVIENPLVSETLFMDCYDETDSFAYYEISVYYDYNNNSYANVDLDISDLNLYDDEKIYYSTDISSLSSWKLLNSETELSISSDRNRTIYYYIESSREGAMLQIQNPEGRVVSITGFLRDCFGRSLSGEISVGDSKFSLRNVKYLDIEQGAYAPYTAKLMRDYDIGEHIIDISGLGDTVLMLSFNGYDTTGSNFENAKLLDEIKIKYSGYGSIGSIFYYIDSNINQYIQITNAEGEVISTNNHVIENNKPLLINNRYVYCLTLISGYYADNEVFYVEVLTSTYTLIDSEENAVDLYLTSLVNGEVVSEMIIGQTYYFVAQTGYIYIINDTDDNDIIYNISEVSSINSETSVFVFTLTIPTWINYVNGSEFILNGYEKQNL